MARDFFLASTSDPLGGAPFSFSIWLQEKMARNHLTLLTSCLVASHVHGTRASPLPGDPLNDHCASLLAHCPYGLTPTRDIPKR